LGALAAAWITSNVLVVAMLFGCVVAAAFVASWLVHRGFVDRQQPLRLLMVAAASMLFAILSWVFLASTGPGTASVAINSPANGAEIAGYQHIVSGTVSDPNMIVHVVVRPLGPLDYWVQSPTTIAGSGAWTVNAHLGEPTAGVGESFEIIAVAHKRSFLASLATGTRLSPGRYPSLPSNMNRSETVIVKRVR